MVDLIVSSSWIAEVGVIALLVFQVTKEKGSSTWLHEELDKTLAQHSFNKVSVQPSCIALK